MQWSFRGDVVLYDRNEQGRRRFGVEHVKTHADFGSRELFPVAIQEVINELNKTCSFVSAN